jgi:hypothetical protein
MLYAPECVEGRFPELRPCGVLGSPPTRGVLENPPTARGVAVSRGRTSGRSPPYGPVASNFLLSPCIFTSVMADKKPSKGADRC